MEANKMKQETAEQRTMNLYQRISGTVTRAAVAGLAMLVMGCSGANIPTKVEIEEEKPFCPSEGAPDWVSKHGVTEMGGHIEDGKIYGVGSADYNNVDFRSSTATKRAIISLSLTFGVYTKTLLKLYDVATGENEKRDEKEHVRDAAIAFSENYISGIRRIDTWYDRVPGCYREFALVELDNNRFKQFIEENNNLGSETQKRIIENADKAFDELEKADYTVNYLKKGQEIVVEKPAQ